MRTKILYEDEHIIVVYKPAGIAVQSAQITRADVESELKGYLAKQTGAEGYLGMVHRLDQPVEGIVVFGKDKGSTARLTKMLQTREIVKEYFAVVWGKPDREEERLEDHLIKKDGRAEIVREKEEVFTGKNKPQRAVLQYSVIKTKETEAGRISLLRIRIETGRFHQIRAQLSHAGMPILGDAKYGSAKSKEAAQSMGICSAALCAGRVEFEHPATGKRMEYTVSPQNPAFAFFGE